MVVQTLRSIAESEQSSLEICRKHSSPCWPESTFDELKLLFRIAVLDTYDQDGWLDRLHRGHDRRFGFCGTRYNVVISS